jgi:hypothetical protein
VEDVIIMLSHTFLLLFVINYDNIKLCICDTFNNIFIMCVCTQSVCRIMLQDTEANITSEK